MAVKIKGIFLDAEFLPVLEKLSCGQLGSLVKALFSMAGYGEMPALDQATEIALTVIAPSALRHVTQRDATFPSRDGVTRNVTQRDATEKGDVSY